MSVRFRLWFFFLLRFRLPFVHGRVRSGYKGDARFVLRACVAVVSVSLSQAGQARKTRFAQCPRAFFVLAPLGLKFGTHEGTSPATSPGDQVPSCELPIFIKNLVAWTKIWSLRLVPRIQTWFDFVGQVAGTCPLKLC